MRVSWVDMARRKDPLAVRLRKPQTVAAGYTPNTLITEWLTVHCRGDWASQSRPTALLVWFADPADFARATAHFEAIGPARDLSPIASTPRPKSPRLAARRGFSSLIGAKLP